MNIFERGQLNNYLAELAQGEPSALDNIYLLVSKQMYALAWSIVKSKYDAEDILHDSFMLIAQNARGFKSGSNGYAWVMKITRNAALDFLRRKGRRAEENIDNFFNLTSGDYDENKRDTAIMLETAIKQLEDSEKKLIYYTYYLDMTVREIAKEMGISKSAVSRQLEKAEKNLKILLDSGTNSPS